MDATCASPGIPTYGVSGFFGDRDDVRAHGRDERMNVNSFYEGQAFLYQLVKELSLATVSWEPITDDVV